jgi:ElaB/YqjD/DUF883 family membrane-anchored ribosome-binding protein
VLQNANLNERINMETRLQEPSAESHGTNREKILEEVKGMIQRAQEKAVDRAKAADKVIRDNPYQTIGLAFGLGLLIGVLIRRK